MVEKLVECFEAEKLLNLTVTFDYVYIEGRLKVVPNEISKRSANPGRGCLCFSSR